MEFPRDVKGLRVTFFTSLDEFQDLLCNILDCCRIACRHELQTFLHFNITLYVNIFSRQSDDSIFSLAFSEIFQVTCKISQVVIVHINIEYSAHNACQTSIPKKLEELPRIIVSRILSYHSHREVLVLEIEQDETFR